MKKAIVLAGGLGLALAGLAEPAVRDRSVLGWWRFDGGDCKAMVDIMTPRHCMGRGRAGAIMANVIVPWAIAEGRLSEAPEWLPPEDVSDPVRLTAFRLFGRDHNPAAFYSTNGLLIQGLLQIHRDYCLQVHPDCSECQFAKS